MNRELFRSGFLSKEVPQRLITGSFFSAEYFNQWFGERNNNKESQQRNFKVAKKSFATLNRRNPRAFLHSQIWNWKPVTVEHRLHLQNSIFQVYRNILEKTWASKICPLLFNSPRCTSRSDQALIRGLRTRTGCRRRSRRRRRMHPSHLDQIRLLPQWTIHYLYPGQAGHWEYEECSGKKPKHKECDRENMLNY